MKNKIKINLKDNNSYFLNVAKLKNGGFVEVWASSNLSNVDLLQSLNITTIYADIYARVYTSSGDSICNDLKINLDENKLNLSPTVVGLKNGNFVVSWIQVSSINNSFIYNVIARIHDNDGVAINSQFKVNREADEKNSSPNLVALENKKFAISWIGYTNNGFRSVLSKIYEENGASYLPVLVISSGNKIDLASNLLAQYLKTTALQNGNFVVSCVTQYTSHTSTINSYIDLNEISEPEHNSTSLHPIVHWFFGGITGSILTVFGYIFIPNFKSYLQRNKASCFKKQKIEQSEKFKNILEGLKNKGRNINGIELEQDYFNQKVSIPLPLKNKDSLDKTLTQKTDEWLNEEDKYETGQVNNYNIAVSRVERLHEIDIRNPIIYREFIPDIYQEEEKEMRMINSSQIEDQYERKKRNGTIENDNKNVDYSELISGQNVHKNNHVYNSTDKATHHYKVMSMSQKSCLQEMMVEEKEFDRSNNSNLINQAKDLVRDSIDDVL